MRELMLMARSGYGAALREEVCRRFGVAAVMSADGAEPDLVRIGPDAALRAWREGRETLIFAAQWMSDPALAPLGRPGAPPDAGLMAGLECLAGGGGPWTLHAFASGGADGEAPSKAAGVLGDALLAACAERTPDLYARYRPPRRAGAGAKVFHLFLTPRGAWWSVMQGSDLLDPHPGGEHRMAFDAGAPCRSYLKLEEAFDVMGVQPRRGERAVDLGAAPGGWSYALLKRGCEVLAVDRGPMKISDRHPSGGRLSHLRVDGVGFRLPRDWPEADWLVCDMLVPPGQTFGLLKRWIQERRMRRFVVNFKIPQQHPDPVLEPVETFLAEEPGVRFRIRQLYHDRREVTVMGACSGLRKR